MSSTRHPVRRPVRRPPSRAVYRRRRLGVAVTAVLLVVATVDLVNGDDDAPADDTVQQVVSTPRATPTTGPTEVPVGPTKDAPRRPAAPRTTAAPAPAEPEGACSDADVTVRPEVGPAVAGDRVVVTLALSTTKAEACTWTVDENSLAYKVTDADGDVWTSSDCPRQVRSGKVVVRRDLVSTYRIAWSGRESSRDCPASMPDADPGTYAVQAAAIGGEPSAVVKFKLVDPGDVEPAGPTASRAKSKSGSSGSSD